MMFEDDGYGWCYKHAIEHAKDEYDREILEESQGFEEFEVAMRAKDKMISFDDARKELIKERGLSGAKQK
jgi:hypothetical protein